MEIVGRQREQEQVDRFFDLLQEGPAALLLEGDSGIGKTTVWRAAVDAARSRSYCILVSRASESEGALSFVGLADLLDGVPNEAFELLPEPQRQAFGAGAPPIER